jgi:predicted metal-dependent TIM-barrel fold hydrolase
MIKSSTDWWISDPLSVPLVAREMRKEEFSNNDIEIQIFYNAYEFYKLSPRMTWSP